MGLLLWQQQCVSAQGTTFTYQGALGVNGAPANGTYDFEFWLYDSTNDPGTVVAGPLIRLGNVLTNGLFTAALDFGATPFNGADRWLEIRLRTNGSGVFSTLLPRQPVSSTPYAIMAGNLSGIVSASQLTGTISTNNIGAGSITTPMLATGAVGSNQLAANAVTTAALADGSVTAAKISTVSNWFGLKIANPSPTSEDLFGSSVALLGNDRVLIGAEREDIGATDAGAVYLFTANGTLLSVLTNPAPDTADFFGSSVAVVGADRVLIGAPGDNGSGTDRGLAYLFSTNGTLLTTFTNPFSGNLENFGASVAALGNDRVLISADGRSSGIGSAYLFRTNGTLLATFNNPTPASLDFFGQPVAALGSDGVLIGARLKDTGATDAGAAYLFSTNGALLNTFTNPTPANSERFGISLAPFGPDRVLIGANSADAAYLFATDGALLTTFTNPAPGSGNSFGFRVTPLGSDRVVILAPGTNVAYLFSTNGALLASLKDPANGFGFGSSLCAVGTDRVLIGSVSDDGGIFAAGVAYLFGAEIFTPGLVAQGVSGGSVNTISLADGAVTAAKLDPTIGVWTRSGTNVYRPAGNVGLGTATPAFQLQLSTDSAGKPNGGSWANSSDARIKKNIQPFTNALEQLMQLHGVRFEWVNPQDHANQLGFQGGFIAQEVERAFPGWVRSVPGAEHDRTLTSDGKIKSLTLPFEFDALLVEAIKEQQQQLKSRDERLRRLEERVTELETLLNQTKH